jgi:hypothetical protein
MEVTMCIEPTRGEAQLLVRIERWLPVIALCLIVIAVSSVLVAYNVCATDGELRAISARVSARGQP